MHYLFVKYFVLDVIKSTIAKYKLKIFNVFSLYRIEKLFEILRPTNFTCLFKFKVQRLIISAILGLTSIHGLGYIDSVVITDREYMHFGGSEIHFWLAQSYNIIQLN